MTNKELQEILKQYPDDYIIYTYTGDETTEAKSVLDYVKYKEPPNWKHGIPYVPDESTRGLILDEYVKEAYERTSGV